MTDVDLGSDPPRNPPDRDHFRSPEYERARRFGRAQRKRELATKVRIFRRAVIIAIGLFLLKLATALATNSLAILASGLDSLLDAALSGLNWFSAVQAERPADPEHPHGHGKIESLVGGVQALLLAAVAVFIAVQALGRVSDPQPVHSTGLGIAVMAFSAAVAFGLSAAIRRQSDAADSPIVAAEQLHYSMDFTTHAGVVIALVLQRVTGIEYFDPFVSLLIAAFVLWQVRGIVGGTAQDLLDRELPSEVQAQIRRVLDEHSSEILGYHGLRTRSAGSQPIVSLHLVLCKAITFETSHHIVDHIEQEISTAVPGADVTIHADPCGEYCAGEDDCPWVRVLR